MPGSQHGPLTPAYALDLTDSWVQVVTGFGSGIALNEPVPNGYWAQVITLNTRYQSDPTVLNRTVLFTTFDQNGLQLYQVASSAVQTAGLTWFYTATLGDIAFDNVTGGFVQMAIPDIPLAPGSHVVMQATNQGGADVFSNMTLIWRLIPNGPAPDVGPVNVTPVLI